MEDFDSEFEAFLFQHGGGKAVNLFDLSSAIHFEISTLIG